MGLNGSTIALRYETGTVEHRTVFQTQGSSATHKVAPNGAVSRRITPVTSK
jgi:hypothetical protein